MPTMMIAAFVVVVPVFLSSCFQAKQKSPLHLQRMPGSIPIGVFALAETARSSSSDATSSSSSSSLPVMEEAASSDLSFLDHLNFDVPNHDRILGFYLDLLGFGLDPRVACNLRTDETDERFGREGLVWASCGPHQFHFPRDPTPQALAGGRIGLRYRSLAGLRDRLAAAETEAIDDPDGRCFESSEVLGGGGDNDDEFDEAAVLRIRDRYGNEFHCREGPELFDRYTQPLVKPGETERHGSVAQRYGREESDCRGIEWVEFDVRPGTAAAIADFYRSVLGAAAAVGDGGGVAAIALGDKNPATGRFPQHLLFRETAAEIPPPGGYHIAVYIEDTDRFEAAFERALSLGLLSTNWRDKADVLTLDDARTRHQFRIRDVLDLATGEPIYHLEHEIRSIGHPTYPGVRPPAPPP